MHSLMQNSFPFSFSFFSFSSHFLIVPLLMHNSSWFGPGNGLGLNKDNRLGLGEETELMSGDVDSFRL